MPGDILLGMEESPFSSVADLAQAIAGTSPRLLRLKFLRGDYSRVRRVTVRLGTPVVGKDTVAA